MTLYTLHVAGYDARTSAPTYELRKNGAAVAAGLYFDEAVARVLNWSAPGDYYQEFDDTGAKVRRSLPQTVESLWESHVEQWRYFGRDRRLVNQWLREKQAGLSAADKLLRLERRG